MTRQKLIDSMRNCGMTEAAELLEQRTSATQKAIVIGDHDDKAYECGLADFLQNNTKWANHRNGVSFIAYFREDIVISGEFCDLSV